MKVIALSETWLNPDSFFSLRDFHIFRKDSLSRNSGSLILAIKRNIPFKIIKDCFQIPNRLECQSILIPVRNQHLQITSIYRFPHSSLRSNEWNELFNFYNSYSLSILIGNFNSHHVEWGSERNDNSGSALLTSALEFSFICLNDGSPTFLTRPNQAKSVIDLSFVSPSLYCLCERKVLSDLYFSDHYLYFH